MSAALEGIRVLELAHERGAFAGKLLADMGADVIVIEPPEGDPTRSYPPFLDDRPGPERSLYWWHYNTSKRGVTLDIEKERGRDLLRKLAATADVVISCEPAERMARLGLDYAELARQNPGLIGVSMTPFGAESPRRNQPITDLTLLAAGGPVWSCGYDDHSLPPVRGGGNQGYATACHYAVLSVLTALLHRQASGQGQHLDVSMYAAANITTEMASYNYLVQGTTVQRQTGRHAMEYATLSTQIPCADGRYVNTGLPPRHGAEFRRLVEWLEELGVDEELPETVFLRMGAERETLDLWQIGTDDEITAIFAAGREAMNFLASRLSAYDFFIGAQKRGMPVGIIYSPEEAFEDEHFRTRGIQVEVEHPELGRSFRYPGAPYAFEKSPWRIQRRAPLLGEHTAEVLAELGVTESELSTLRASGVV